MFDQPDFGKPADGGDERGRRGGRAAAGVSRSLNSWLRLRRLRRGSAGAAGAMAAGLGAMVASMSRGKKAYLQYEAQLSAAMRDWGRLREELKAAIDADAQSYNSVMKAYKTAKRKRTRRETLMKRD